MTRNRYRVFESEFPFLVTGTVVNWLDLLKPNEVKQIIIDSLRFLKQENSLKVFAFVIMQNHLHLIVSSNNLPGVMCRFKSFTAKKIIQYYKASGETHLIQKLSAINPEYHSESKHQFWQEGYCPKKIIDFKTLQQKIDYIHFNPVRKGYVDSPEQWKWSSARIFAGMDGMLEIDPIMA